MKRLWQPWTCRAGLPQPRGGPACGVQQGGNASSMVAAPVGATQTQCCSPLYNTNAACRAACVAWRDRVLRWPVLGHVAMLGLHAHRHRAPGTEGRTMGLEGSMRFTLAKAWTWARPRSGVGQTPVTALQSCALAAVLQV